MEHQFFGKFVLRGDMLCVTGLHIGGTTTGVEIGGIENPVIKDPRNDEPYIPGSSLKGKLRSLLEWSKDLIGEHPKHKSDGRKSYAAYACETELKQRRDEFPDKERWDAAYALARLFGPASDDPTVRATAGPSRLIVR